MAPGCGVRRPPASRSWSAAAQLPVEQGRDVVSISVASGGSRLVHAQLPALDLGLRLQQVIGASISGGSASAVLSAFGVTAGPSRPGAAAVHRLSAFWMRPGSRPRGLSSWTRGKCSQVAQRRHPGRIRCGDRSNVVVRLRPFAFWHADSISVATTTWRCRLTSSSSAPLYPDPDID